MRENFNGLFVPAYDSRGHHNPEHLERARYLAIARETAVRYARENGIRGGKLKVVFPDADSFAPLRVRVKVVGSTSVQAHPVGGRGRSGVEVRAASEAELIPPGGYGWNQPRMSEGDGYNGPLAYRQGKPMRPDVARAFDRMYGAALRDGVSLIVTSAYRSDAEQAELWKRNPNPKWVAPPGKSLHRLGTELDLGPPSAYGWLAANAGRFGFIQRYSWEPWHYGYRHNPRSTPTSLRGAGRPKAVGGEGGSATPSFVPAAYVSPIARASSRYNVSAALLAAQLYVESNFNPYGESHAGAQGIAQFMPATARAYGLKNPFDPEAAIDAQARLMRDLLGRFAAVPLALAAYNAGPARVAACGCVPPIPETQAYVARVLALMGGTGEVAVPELEVRLVA